MLKDLQQLAPTIRSQMEQVLNVLLVQRVIVVPIQLMPLESNVPQAPTLLKEL
jgi:hypothetical protein